MSPHRLGEWKNRLRDPGYSPSLVEAFEMARSCADGLAIPELEAEARDVIIRGLAAQERFPDDAHALWNGLVEAAGLYPYANVDQSRGSSSLRHEFHRSRAIEDITLHEEQTELLLRLLEGESVVLSAPTSYGKSLLIEELVASRQFRNIVIIQPTLALIDETRKKLQKYRHVYRLIVSTGQQPSDSGGNVFLFTAERVIEYAYFGSIDFFVIDEFYKLSLNREDDRAIALNHALYKLLKHTHHFYMLGPLVRSIPTELSSNLGALWRRTTFSTVAVDEHERLGPQAEDEKRRLLYSLLVDEVEGPTMIYCSSKAKAAELASGLLAYIGQSAPWMKSALRTTANNELVEWIAANIHPSWQMAEVLAHSIAFHHGAVPRHLGSSIVDAFNQGSIKFLFCTSTLIEGVNTAAKNVVLYDRKKGTKKIDYFDYRNIAGRSGRMAVYYVGNVYKLCREPEQLELDIDVPVLTQDEAPLELLIQVDRQDLTARAKERLCEFTDVDPALMAIIKGNAGLPLEGQLELVEEVASNSVKYRPLLNWKSIPTYDQLVAVVELLWRYLRRKGESRGSARSPRQLALYTLKYITDRSLTALIDGQIQSEYWINECPDLDARVNTVVSQILDIARHWFDFKLPKLLRAVSALQSFVLDRKGMDSGDYTYCAALLENSFLSGGFAALLDLDVPLSAVQKIEGVIGGELENLDEVLRRIGTVDLSQIGLSPYERHKIEALL